MTCFEQLLSLLAVFGTPKITMSKVSPGTADSPDNQWLNTARPPVVVSVGRGCHRPTLRRFALHQPDIPLHLHVQSNLSVKYRLRSQCERTNILDHRVTANYCISLCTEYKQS